ncbi:MAG: hypothetical protein HY597_02690 [Candidatus Omnitrophica bacterium]|nr:hypothetical protein [Candidatus Omnitrophota bacterium]
MSAYLGAMILLASGAVFITRSVTESRAALRARDSEQALHLADAAVARTGKELAANFNWNNGGVPLVATLGPGQYEVQSVVNGPGADERTATVVGYIPNRAAPELQRKVEAVVRQRIPPNFYDYALYSAGEIDLNGNAYDVNGDIIAGDQDPITNTDNVSGTITTDPTISPLAKLSFSQLYDWAAAQGHVYDAARLANVKTTDPFPSSFWCGGAQVIIPPAPPGCEDPSNPGVAMPNVVYVTTDLALNGNIGTIGGFYVVVGDVLSNPNGDPNDTTINGNGQIDGVIYTTGEFRVNGGAGGLNVEGGVWAGTQARLNGNATVTYNSTYMDAIQAMNINASVQLVLWREL